LTLAFVARRLLAERAGVVFSVRDGAVPPELDGLPHMLVEGLGEGDARALLAEGLQGPLDPAVADRLTAETRGNPLALLELPRSMTPTELAGGFGLPARGTMSGRIEDSFVKRIDPLPEPTQQLLLIAAAEPTGDPMVVWRAARRLGVERNAAAPATTDGLITF